ncbi:LacI family transcriptional regulator [Brevundimonas sp. LM2]|uniref:LacI family DNA-binding transcriptional regulator n=1 Tax=Brevundimonas sp. LM2 TaxID=1938605 RepID=UPI0009839322|nr:LacI family DNA-binding transcriptional regulator [Brevundimonas sp. LM2]AQR63115.1 LacI family transcriptional regulator [Brevundimonas sp. LM2]
MTSDAPADLATFPRRARTIVDLAKLAGVSPSTISRALADKSVVKATTVARIKALAREHDFRLNQMASGLRTRRTGVIGVVVPLGHERRQHLSDPFFLTMLGHFADALTENGYDMMISRIIPDAPDWLERIVDSGKLDGVLVLGHSNQVEAIERVARQYAPMVVWGSAAEAQTHCCVGTDNRLGGYIAGQHLISVGARRIAFFGDLRAPELRHRFDGLSQAMTEAGFIEPPLVLETHLAVDVMGREIADHLDRYGERIDGVFAGSDVIALTTLRALADRGVAVPDKVKVIGFDDLPLAMQAVPRITTIRQDFQTGARAMIDRLFLKIEGKPVSSVTMAPRLIVRDSTATSVR